jgi:hypothetical protein
MLKKIMFFGLVCTLLLLGVPGLSYASSLLAHWSFDEPSGSTIAHDSGPNGYNGILLGDAKFVTGGVSNGAVSLTHTGNGMVYMGNVLNNLAGTSYTISAWIKTWLVPGDETNQTVVASHRESIGYSYVLGINTSGQGAAGGSGKGWFYNGNKLWPTSAINVVDGDPNDPYNLPVWHLLVGVRNEVTQKVSLYVDGNFQDIQTFGDGMGNSDPGTPLVFGGLLSIDTNRLMQRYTGLIDDVQFFSGALTSDEIKNLYDSKIPPGPLPGAIWLLGSGLVGLAGWRRFRKG